MDAEILPESAQRVSKGCPHCRDAPWGVSEAAASPVLSQTPRGRAVALGIVLSAPETPHGASLQWGAPDGIATFEAPSQCLAPLPAHLDQWRRLEHTGPADSQGAVARTAWRSREWLTTPTARSPRT